MMIATFSNSLKVLAFAALLFIAAADKDQADPVAGLEIPSTYPGEVIASSSTYWIAPYVLYEEVAISGEPSRKVVFYSEDGSVIKNISARWIDANSYYVLERDWDTTIVHSIHDTVTIRISGDSLRAGESIHGQDYGMYFFWQYKKDHGLYTDFYSHGALVGTYGPHCWFVGQPFNVSRSGSFAYSIDDSTDEKYCQVISCDSLGNEIFSFRSDGPLTRIIPSLTGERVIISYNLDKDHDRGSKDFACFSSTGDTVRAQPGRPIGWVPGTNKMITTALIGEKYGYQLINWEDGEIVWKVSDPLEYTPMTTYDGLAIGEDYLILSGLAIRESIAHGPVIPNRVTGPIRMLAAIEIESGELVAKWYEPTLAGTWIVRGYLPPLPTSGGRLIFYKNELYHVTPENFSRIDFDEIRELKNGWVDPQDSGRVYPDDFK